MARIKESDKEKIRNETRTRLLDAAADEIAREGYPGANINRISTRAGFAKGTIYNYFASKQALLLDLLDEIAAEQIGTIASYVRQSEDPIERLELFYKGGFKFVELHPSKTRTIIYVLYGPNEEFKEHMWRSYIEMFRIMEQDIVRVGVETCVFRNVDIPDTAALLISIYLGGCVGVDEQGRRWLQPASIADFALQSLRKPKKN